MLSARAPRWTSDSAAGSSMRRMPAIDYYELDALLNLAAEGIAKLFQLQTEVRTAT